MLLRRAQFWSAWVAICLCPATCLSGHDGGSELPGPPDGQEPCSHACFCSGAVSVDRQVGLQITHLPVAAALPSALIDDSATNVVAHIETLSGASRPPPCERILPLLI